eukprot:gene3766-5945_t
MLRGGYSPSVLLARPPRCFVLPLRLSEQSPGRADHSDPAEYLAAARELDEHFGAWAGVEMPVRVASSAQTFVEGWSQKLSLDLRAHFRPSVWPGETKYSSLLHLINIAPDNLTCNEGGNFGEWHAFFSAGEYTGTGFYFPGLLRSDRPEVTGVPAGELPIVDLDPGLRHHVNPTPVAKEDVTRYHGEGMPRCRQAFASFVKAVRRGRAPIFGPKYRFCLFRADPTDPAVFGCIAGMVRQQNAVFLRLQMLGKRNHPPEYSGESPALWQGQERIFAHGGGQVRLRAFLTST